MVVGEGGEGMSEKTIFVCRPCYEQHIVNEIPADCFEESWQAEDGTIWTTMRCPLGHSVMASADKGELDLGILRES